MVTSRVRIGHMVICTAFRNPALTAKLASTIDVISGGRFELGIGAGWYEHEWLAYGYGFPPVGERLGQLGDHLEVISRMLGAGPGDVRGPLRRGRWGDQRAEGRPAPHPGDRRGQRAAADGGLCRAVRGRAQLRVPAARPAPRPHRRGPRAMRGGGPRPGDAPVLDVRPRRGDAARARRESTRSARCARRSSTGSCASPDAGIRRRTARPRSPTTAGRGFVLGGAAAAAR